MIIINSRNHRACGFTIIELIIVLIIMGVIATLVIPRLISTNESAICSEAISTLSTMRSAQARYNLEKGTFAGTDCSALDIAVNTPKFFDTPTCDSGTGAVTLSRVGGPVYTATAAQTGSPVYTCTGAGCTTAVLRSCFSN